MAELIADFPLLSCNTFGFDVRARYGCLLESLDDLTQVLAEPRLAGLPRLVLGGGSNVVLRGDFDGVVWLMRLRGRRLLREDDDAYYVEAAAGENWHELVAWTLQQGWPGLENLALIPGTVGAAPIQNIGAYGLELADRCASVSAFDLERGERVEFDAAACRFGYRDSFFKQQGRDRYVIVSVTLRLPKPWRSCADYADVRRELGGRGITSPKAQDIFDAVVAIRRAKLPDPAQIGNAGSFFKNPVVSAPTAAALAEREPQLVSYAQPDGRVKLAAGWLIDQCGWKGQTLGPAGVHPRQALVLINHGGATGADVLTLAQQIRDSVRARFGVELEAEPVVI